MRDLQQALGLGWQLPRGFRQQQPHRPFDRGQGRPKFVADHRYEIRLQTFLFKPFGDVVQHDQQTPVDCPLVEPLDRPFKVRARYRCAERHIGVADIHHPQTGIEHILAAALGRHITHRLPVLGPRRPAEPCLCGKVHIAQFKVVFGHDPNVVAQLVQGHRRVAPRDQLGGRGDVRPRRDRPDPAAIRIQQRGHCRLCHAV